MFRYRQCAVIVGMVICVAFIWAQTAAAAPRPPEPEIDIQFDRQAFVAGEPFQVTIAITTEGQGEPTISLPTFNGFQVLRKNVTRPSSGYSFSFSFGSGQQARKMIQNSGTTRYDIVLMASKPGKMTIDPVKVVLDGYTFNGKSYPIEVFDRGGASTSGTPAQGTDSKDLTEAQLEGAQIDPDYFLHMIPSRTECTIGEQIVLDVYLFTSVGNIRSNQFEREPGTEGFWVERFEDFDLRNQRNQQVVINGTLYEQVLLKKLALFPVKAGKLTISPPVFSFVVGGGGFFSFARGKEVKRAASAITVDVAPLPDAGKPDGFNEANIGRFSFLVDANAKEVKVGDPVTVTVNVRGTGNIRNVVLPAFKEVEGFKTYAPETDVEVQARGGVVSGVSQSQTLFIPEVSGNLTVPSLTFSYFDPSTQTYDTRTSEPIRIRVKKGNKRPEQNAEVSMTSSKRTEQQVSAPVERMNNNMRTIIDDVDISKSGAPMFARIWYLTLVFGVPLLFIAYLMLVRWRQRSAQNFQKSRSRRAESDAQKALGHLQRDKGQSNDKFFSQLHRVLLTFLEDRLEENVVGDTMNQLHRRLVSRGVDEELARDVIAMLESYEFARFAKSGSDETARQEDVKQATALVSRLGSVQLSPLPDTKGGRS